MPHCVDPLLSGIHLVHARARMHARMHARAHTGGARRAHIAQAKRRGARHVCEAVSIHDAADELDASGRAARAGEPSLQHRHRNLARKRSEQRQLAFGCVLRLLLVEHCRTECSCCNVLQWVAVCCNALYLLQVYSTALGCTALVRTIRLGRKLLRLIFGSLFLLYDFILLEVIAHLRA
jgi:hypothetical protein